MDQRLSGAVNADDVLDVVQPASPTALWTIAVRFILLLAAIVAVFAWTWSR